MRATFFLSTVFALGVLSMGVAACGDDLTGADPALDGAEAEAVLRSAAALPALPAVINRAGDPPTAAGRASLYRAQELWAAGSLRSDDAARASRRLAASYAAPTLAESLGDGDWDDVKAGLLAWIITAEDMLRHLDLDGLDAHLWSARGYIRQADEAADRVARARLLLFAGADLVETTPRTVARRLVTEAGEAVQRVADAEDADAGGEVGGVTDADGRSSAVEETDLQRARRLQDWAARALEGGEYLLAAQRAYYAIQLMEGR